MNSPRWKHALSRWIPPALRPPPSPELTWTGVYPHLRDVPTRNGTFDATMAARMAASTRAALARVKGGAVSFAYHEPLALAVALARRPRVRILDFGGGTGEGYVQLLGSLPAGVTVEYRVVDLPSLRDEGERLFAGDPCIRFHTELPPPDEAFDIVYASSVLQYIEDYAALLRRLAGYGAPVLLLARLACGEMPTYATAQVNVPDRVLPYWFLNTGEVARLLGECGYSLACQSLMDRVYDQSNFPPEQRCERMRNLLFLANRDERA